MLHRRATDRAHGLFFRRYFANIPTMRDGYESVAVGQADEAAGPVHLFLCGSVVAAVLPDGLAVPVHLDDEEAARAAVAVAAADKRVAIGQAGGQVREWQ